jgi:hypothetical protein
MKAYQKTIIYVLDDLNEIEKETEKQRNDGWRVYKQGEVTKSYLFPNKKEVEIIYMLRE